MKRQDVKCKHCGNLAELHGGAYKEDEYGPFMVICSGCCAEVGPWAYPREAWKEWSDKNGGNKC